MRRSIKLLCFAVLLALAITGCRQADSNPLTESIFKITVDKQFNLAKQRVDAVQMVTLFTPPVDATSVLFAQKESGNAAELYWAALKDRVDQKSEVRQQLLDQLGPLSEAFELAIKDNAPISP